jgi:hypothetical protein
VKNGQKVALTHSAMQTMCSLCSSPQQRRQTSLRSKVRRFHWCSMMPGCQAAFKSTFKTKAHRQTLCAHMDSLHSLQINQNEARNAHIAHTIKLDSF